MEAAAPGPQPQGSVRPFTISTAADWGDQQRQCSLFDGLAAAVRDESRSLPSCVRQHVPKPFTFAHVADLDRMSKQKAWSAKAKAAQGALLHQALWLVMDGELRGLCWPPLMPKQQKATVLSALGRSIGQVFEQTATYRANHDKNSTMQQTREHLARLSPWNVAVGAGILQQPTLDFQRAKENAAAVAVVPLLAKGAAPPRTPHV